MSAFTDRLVQNIRVRESQLDNPVQVDREQLALVCRALADHTLLMQALTYAPSADGPWPEATSLGRYFHHLADEFLDASP